MANSASIWDYGFRNGRNEAFRYERHVLITRRSSVRILPPRPNLRSLNCENGQGFLIAGEFFSRKSLLRDPISGLSRGVREPSDTRFPEPGDAQRMELLNMPGDGSDVWLDVRTVQLYLQISLTSIYKLIHAGKIPAVKLGTKTIRVNRKALEEYLQSAQQMADENADGGDEQ